MKQCVVMVSCSVILISCATGPTESKTSDEDTEESTKLSRELMDQSTESIEPTKKENRNYGPRPDNPKELAEKAISKKLIDSGSARYHHYDQIKKGHFVDHGVRYNGWIQCGKVNSKNRFGGYAGRKQYFVLIKNGEVLLVKYDTELDTPSGVEVTHDIASEKCSEMYGR